MNTHIYLFVLFRLPSPNTIPSESCPNLGPNLPVRSYSIDLVSLELKIVYIYVFEAEGVVERGIMSGPTRLIGLVLDTLAFG